MNYIKEIEKIAKTETNKLTQYVALYIVDYLNGNADNEQVEAWFNDLMRGGCQSGFIGELIYYHDTKEFFTKFMDEIEDLKDDMEENLGEPLKIGRPTYNWLAWFGFEETARKIAEEIGLEI